MASKEIGLGSAEFRAALESVLPVGVVTIDRTGRQGFVSDQFAEMVGFARGELEGVEPPFPYWPQERREELTASIHRLLRSPATESSAQAEFRRKDGTLFPVEVVSAPLVSPDGSRHGWLACVTDVSKRREALEALEASEARHRSLIELAPSGIGIAIEGKVAFVNSAAARILGAESTADLIGRPVLEIVHPNERAVAAKNLAELMQGQAPMPLISHTFVRLDGSPVPVRIAATPITFHGQPAVQVVFHDMSKVEQEHSELVALRTAVEKSSEIVFVTDKDGVFSYVNPEFTRAYGWPAEEVVGLKTPRILKSGDIAPEHYERFWQTITSKQVASGEWRNRTRDGRLVDVEGSANPILDQRGDIVGFLALQRDVTARNRAAEERAALNAQLQHAQKMEAVGRLAGGVAHDFNNILSVMLTYAGFVRDELQPADPMREDVEEILRAVQRAAGLARQLLIFSRRDVVRPRPTDLNEVLSQMERLLGRTLGEDVSLVTAPDPGLWPAMVDPAQIEQVLVNLAVNARDAMPDGGRLVIQTRNVEVETDSVELTRGRYVELSVEDTGTGMTAEVAARAFEPFFTTKAHTKGTGLGLAMVYGIVKQAGGDVTLTSELGQGTRFRIRLPVAEGAAASIAPVQQPAAEQTSGTVLVVEDEESVRTAMVRILERAGYDVFSAANAGEALLICEREGSRIELLLTDVVMPQLSGKDLADRLQRLSPALRVAFTSGHSESVLVHDGRVPPEAILLEKPFTSAALLAAVRAGLGSETSAE